MENYNDFSEGDDDSKLGPSLPAGVLRRKGAVWEGEEMELDHYREGRGSANKKRKDASAAVDISQFQNTVVGQGYQAKHVIRQRTNAATSIEKDQKLYQISDQASAKNPSSRSLSRPKEIENNNKICSTTTNLALT
eukprot:CAMPEP_0172430058 /NCGR_PEP_ID=MMETSP1064-20121228/52914_1 /TAXON_ID=202472 /ORGANISM="Aulacoseira subarctica , Strain CCAP 1002/5" /LENGTH=135 /DNA_ID=CAMNT_0013175849 /DNA_START=242 /DNA_END=645 /DNA_ORIENTATION=+